MSSTIVYKDYDMNDFVKFYKMPMLNDHAFTLLSLNIRSIGRNILEFDMFLHNLNRCVDIIVLTECWTQAADLYKNYFQLYNVIFSDKSNRSGGVAIFYNKLTIKPQDFLINVVQGADTVMLTFNSDKLSNQKILAVYRSPSQDANIFLNSIKKLSTTIEHKPTIIVGDFNLNLLNYFNDVRTETLYDNLLESGYSPVIETPTRITNNSLGSIIDQIFINFNVIHQPDQNYSGNINAKITDHQVQYLILTNSRSKMVKGTNVYFNRSYDDSSVIKFTQSLIENNSLCDTNSISNPNILYNEFSNNLLNIFENSFPIKKIKKRKITNKRWFNHECISAHKKKISLYKKFQKSRSIYDEYEYKKQNRLYKNLIKHTKNEFHRETVKKCKGNSRQTWKVLNQLLGKCNDKSSICLRINGEIICDARTNANALNKYFNTVGKVHGFNPLHSDSYEPFLGKKEVDSFFYYDITPDEVVNILKKLDVTKATFDVIPLKIFKTCPKFVFRELAFIFNKCIKEGIMPDKLKHSRIIPVHKGGSKLDCTNYRPISLLSYIDKILEKAIHKRLYTFLNRCNFFCKNQYGFRENHSTEIALMSVMNRIYKLLDDSKFVLLISVDFRKAFDVIRHDILIRKLEHYGIRGFMLDWFKSYLSERSHLTMVDSISSNYLHVKTGIPQGSSLGPLLFLIYINDLKNIFDDNEFNVFADDTTLIVTSDNLKDLMAIGNRKLTLLDNFLKTNGISINEAKTAYMILSPKGKLKNQIPDPLYCYNKPLGQVNVVKLLGISIDKRLSFSHHIENVMKNRLRKFIPIFYKLRNFLSTKTMLMIYYSNIYSILSYCILVYGTANLTFLRKLDRLHSRILKIILRVNTENLPTEMNDNNILDVNGIYKFKLLTLGHKLIYNSYSLPEFLKHQYKSSEHLNIRNKDDYNVPYYRTSTGQKCIDFRLCEFWNNLPRSVKDIANFKLFKITIKNMLKQHKLK